MHDFLKHIAFKIAALLIVATLTAPTIVKFAHIFEHHEHVVCKGDSSTHIHQVDLDCEFSKFQLNNHFLIPGDYVECKEISNYIQPEIVTYTFLKNHSPLSISLRGPPILV